MFSCLLIVDSLQEAAGEQWELQLKKKEQVLCRSYELPANFA